MQKTTIHPTRRRWLESATLLTAATVIGCKPEQSKLRSSAEPAANSTSLPEPEPLQPEPLLDPLPAHDPTYADFLAQFQFRHIKTQEVINPHLSTTRGVSNTLPPIELWSAMPATLFVADEIRERLGLPLKLITSAYRNPTYNRACGGASQSWHTKNCALDLVFEGGPRQAHAIARDLRDEGLFQGGIGLYRTFIHLDTRGENADWRG